MALLRLNLRGVEVGDRWQKLLPAIRPYLHDHLSAFFDLQYLYALAKAEKSELADQMLQSLEDYAHTAKPFIRQTWIAVALPAAEAMLAHANHDWRTVSDRLGAVLPRLPEIGGSNAERKLFEQIYQDAQTHLCANTR